MEIIIECLNEFNIISITFRLCLAIVLGGIIGIDRERATRSAGFRTYSLVCLGSTLVMLIGNYLHVNIDSSGDVARLGAQVISGIGFLGGGAIISSKNQKVRGLTTAAALWTCACIGLAIGIGFYSGAIISCIFTYLVLKVLRIVDKRYRRNYHFVDIYVEIKNASDITDFITKLNQDKIKIIALESVSPKINTSELGIKLIVQIGRDISSDGLVKSLSDIEYINFVHKVYI